MMKLHEIRTEVISKLQGMLPDDTVSLEEVDVVKLNDLYQYGISFRSGDVGKTLYINDFVSDGKTSDEIADEMLSAYENSVDAPPYELITEMQTKQSPANLADNLFVALLEIARNEAYLKDIPYREVGNGFAFICQIRHMDPSGCSFISAAVTKGLADSNDWSIDEVFDIAINNTLRSDAPMLFKMEDALMGNPENMLNADGDCTSDLLVLTNAAQTFGAAALFLPGVIDKIHACLGGGFFAIPSSLHEFIIVAESMKADLDELSAMCKEANASIVEQRDILSDHVLHFTMK